MVADPYEQLRRTFSEQHDDWDRVRRHLDSRLRTLTRQRFLPAVISSRVKDVSSLVLKAHLKGRSEIDSFHDLCAMRVSIPFADDTTELQHLVEESFDCPNGADDKSAQLGADGIGYRGIHYDVRLPCSEVEGLTVLTGTAWCEIQLHTLASELWASTGHDLGYKAAFALPPELARSINRLSALTEIYDTELVRTREAIEGHPDYALSHLARQLASVFYAVTGVVSEERALSDAVLAVLAPTISSPAAEYGAALREFVARERDRLEVIYGDRDPTVYDVPLLLLPVALLVFERLETDEPRLRATWAADLPEPWLDQLLVVWGGLDD